MHEEDKNVLGAIASGGAKAIGYICLTVFACMWLSNCTLQESTIISCQESCDSSGTQMQSVTSSECVCAEKNRRSDIWVAPNL